ncbi:hypothetical protein ACLOJK_025209 [Asimina triloba]
MEMAQPTTEKHAAATNDGELRYRGVRKRKWGKWVSEIRLPNSRERIWLGSYDKPEKAARAFDAAVFCLRGTKGKFNFPDRLPDIAAGGSLSAAEIQAAAARFANDAPQALSEKEPSSAIQSLTSESESCGAPPAGGLNLGNDWFFDQMVGGFDSTSSDFGPLPAAAFDNFREGIFPAMVNPPSAAGVDVSGEEGGGGGFYEEDPFLWNF